MRRGLQQNHRLNRRQKRAVHISWHIAALSSGLVIGTALTAIKALQYAAEPIWLLAAFLIAVLAFSQCRRAFVTLALIAGLVFGLWRGANVQHSLATYHHYYKQNVSLRGVVVEDVSHGKQGDVRLQLKHISINGHPMSSKVWVSLAPTKKVIKRSDTLTLSGKLNEGFGNIPASMTGATLVRFEPTSRQDTALTFRDWFASGIRRAIPEPAASLGSGFLTGQHSDLPANLAEELKAVGLTHAVVASGSNLTILVAFTRKLFSKASKYTATMCGAAMTLGFIMVTGFSPSMTRAGLVTGLSLAAWYYGRRIHPLVLLPFSAAITVVYNPSYVWGDIGWDLSFAAFAGVLILAPLIQHYFWGRDYKPNLIVEILIGTTAAQLATMPVILAAFGTYSSYALLANILVLPLIPLAMALTFAAGIAGVALPAFAPIIGTPAHLVMEYMLTVIHRVANLPGAQGQISFSQTLLAVSYAILIVAAVYMWRKTSHSFRQGSNILIGERT